ncbi:MAG: hypothetical protein GC156_09855 [Actinomycetales bacterium]|nr:hypothetical protein [Actinomycetales bacterium]
MSARLLGGALALTVCMAMIPLGATSANAADGSGDPPRDLIVQTYGSTPPEWAPQGTVIAASGFDPAFDSFPFTNYGPVFGEQNALLGYPAGQRPLGLTAAEVQKLFGPDACTTIQNGTCILNPAVSMWMASINAGMAGGHCFGIAAVVAGLFNGVVSRAALTPSSVNATVALSPAMQRTIAQWFATQQFVLADDDLMAADFLPPDQLVNQLVRFLPSGQLPYVLALFWIEGGRQAGHGITPYAVYSRGPDLVDIAVYDNNYPLQARAIHVDLAANTWEYEVFATPGEPATIASGDADSLNLGLIPLSQLTGRHECAFCALAPEGRSLLMVSGAADADVAGKAFDVRVRTADGQPMRGVRELPQLSPDSTSRSFSVPTSADYRVEIEALQPGTTEIAVASYAPGDALTATFTARKGGVADVSFRQLVDRVQISTNPKAEAGMVSMNRDRRTIDYSLMMFSGSKAWAKADTPTPDLVVRETKGAVVVDVTGNGVTEGALLISRISPATGVTDAISSFDRPLRLRPGDSIVIDTATWRSREAPSAVVTTAKGTTTRLKLMTASPNQRRLVAEQPFGALGCGSPFGCGR